MGLFGKKKDFWDEVDEVSMEIRKMMDVSIQQNVHH